MSKLKDQDPRPEKKFRRKSKPNASPFLSKHIRGFLFAGYGLYKLGSFLVDDALAWSEIATSVAENTAASFIIIRLLSAGFKVWFILDHIAHDLADAQSPRSRALRRIAVLSEKIVRYFCARTESRACIEHLPHL